MSTPTLLTKISKGKQGRALRIMLHGEGGVGKSTFFAGAPDTLFCDPEQRTGHLDVFGRFVPTTWLDVLGFMKEVIETKPCQNVAFSTIDYIEAMLWKHLCKTHEASNIEELGGGWGKGYRMARDEFGQFLNGMEKLVDRGIGVFIEAHSEVESFRNPTGEDYDRFSIKLHKTVRPNFVAKMDAIGFATFQDFATKKDKSDKTAKAITTGQRIAIFGHNPACQTKAGFALPDQMALNWAEFSKHINKESK